MQFNAFVRVLALLLTLGWACGAEAFGPAPDPEEIAAERERLVQRREEVGDHAFFHELIAKLLLLSELPPRGYPSSQPRVWQEGTGEYLRATRPHFVNIALEMVREVEGRDASQVMEVLWRFVAFAVRDHRADTEERWMILNWSGYQLAEESWLILAFREMGFEEALMHYISEGGSGEAVQAALAYTLAQRQVDRLYVEDGDEGPHLIDRLADTFNPRSIDTFNAIEAIAETGAVELHDWQRGAVVETDPALIEGRDAFAEKPWRLQVAVAILYYEEARRAGEAPDGQAQRERYLDVYTDVWRRLLKERLDWNRQPERENWVFNTERLDRLLFRMVQQVHHRPFEWGVIDPVHVQLMVDSSGYGFWYTPLHHQMKGHIALSPEQMGQIVGLMADPMVDPDNRQGIAIELLKERYTPARREIIEALNEMRVLKDHEVHPWYRAMSSKMADHVWEGFLEDVAWLVQEEAGAGGDSR